MEPSLFRKSRKRRVVYRAQPGALFVDRGTGGPAEATAIILEAIRRTEIRQGALGNCHFLAAVGALARLAPERLFELYEAPSEGGCAIRLHTRAVPGRALLLRELRLGAASRARLEIQFRFPVFEDSGEPAYSRPYVSERGLYEVWLMALEKAYAQLCGAYFWTQVGFGGHALATLTGLHARIRPPGLWGFERLAEAVAGGSAVLMTTTPNFLLRGRFTLPKSHPEKLFPAHVYQVVRTDGPGHIRLINPHGPERGVEVDFASVRRYAVALTVCEVRASG